MGVPKDKNGRTAAAAVSARPVKPNDRAAKDTVVDIGKEVARRKQQLDEEQRRLDEESALKRLKRIEEEAAAEDMARDELLRKARERRMQEQLEKEAEDAAKESAK